MSSSKHILTIATPSDKTYQSVQLIRFILHGDLEQLKEFGDDYYQAGLKMREAAKQIELIKVRSSK